MLKIISDCYVQTDLERNFMTLQVLVVTMNQPKGDYSLLDKMNIQTDAIVCNQCDYWDMEEFEYRGNHIKWMSFAERGVGLNRNNGLMRATADIVLFADDDVRYLDGYANIIEKYYQTNPLADVVIFNLNKKYEDGHMKPVVVREGSASSRDITKYGTIFISARRERLHFNNISFHLQFGGGTKYSCGEDTLFLQECYKKGLRIYTAVQTIGSFELGESTWFKGYTDKFFFDKGVVYYCINRKLAIFLSFYHCFKHRKKYKEYDWKKGFLQMRKGVLQCKRGE